VVMSDVRRALERAGERFELAPGGLDRLLDRRSRRQRNRRIGAVVVALVIATAGIGGMVMAIRDLGDQTRPATTPSISLAPQHYLQIAGTYTLTLSKDDPRVQELDLAGRYTMRLLPDGVMLLSVPGGFGGEGPSPSGISFRLSGNQFTTNAFVNFTCPGSVGVYRWELDGDRLTFAPLEEECEVRQVLFSSEPWRAQP
jgi:hypothetical protein